MPKKICKVLLQNGAWIREDGNGFDCLRVYIYEDPDKPGSNECWLFDGPFPDAAYPETAT